MRFLADMGVDRAPDQQVFALALSEDRIVLTFDLDFGEIAALSPRQSARVILFRLSNARSTRVIERLAAVLVSSAEVLENPVIILVEEFRHRIRHLPIGQTEA